MIGKIISHYEIRKLLGSGGMGEVYLATDTNLGRPVALKILPAELVANTERLHRFVTEAKMASAVNHPGVAHIYEIGQADGIHFISMEYIDGETLASKVKEEALPFEEVIRIAIQIVTALQAAHAKSIIHRDVKPSNIMITPSGSVKLLDFGLAKLNLVEGENASNWMTAAKTKSGTVLGTLPYMSPEQLDGKELDFRTDFFSLGIVLYQLSTGQHPFDKANALGVAQAILNQNYTPSHLVNNKIPSEFSAVIAKLLAKNRDQRYHNSSELLLDLERLNLREARSPRVRAILLSVSIFAIAVIAGLGIWQYQKAKKIQYAREVLLPKILQLTDEAKYPEAFALALEAEVSIPNDPILKRQWPLMSRMISLKTDPLGADVFIKEYRDYNAKWNHIGQTPLRDQKVFRGYFRIKITKPGFQSAYRAVPDSWYADRADILVKLDVEEKDQMMVRIPSGRIERPFQMDVQEFWMDKYEVTNREFKRFVDADGYSNAKYWKYNNAEERKNFVDTTGKPGPAGWELSDYHRGDDNLPVTGVSWYEAAAYAEFVNKSLPTYAQWRYAAGVPINFEIIPLSNFGGKGPHAITNEKSLSPFGTFDMAGNVKEWIWNEAGAGQRHILGGAYNDQEYVFQEGDRRPPHQREKTFGFRCVKFISKPDLASIEFNPIEQTSRNFDLEKPVSDEAFDVIKSFYDYAKTDLGAKIESIEESDPNWRKEKISFNAAYGKDRLPAYLYIPKKVKGPYQTVVFFPGLWALSVTSSERIENDIDYGLLDFVIKSGRALMYPVYKGTFERGAPALQNLPPDEFREWTFQYIKDLRRSLDYLETRSDIDKTKFAYYGYSWGGRIGSIVGGVENRFQTLILAHAGFRPTPKEPEVEELNFSPRVTKPVLMINGRYDHIYVVESSQKPFFRFLGTPEKDKVHLIYDGGHTSPRNEMIKAVLGWLDRYLGPVKKNNSYN
jgi:serine/threonine protein kinase/dienelactone hydrolase